MPENKTQIVVIVITVLLAGLILSPRKPEALNKFLGRPEIEKGIDLAGGAELRYRALFKDGYTGDKTKDLQKIQEVLQNRFQSARGALLEPRITPTGDDQIILQMPGIDRDKLEDYKKLVTTIGKLELKEVGNRDIHEEYIKTGSVPAGYEWYPAGDHARDQNYEFLKNGILTRSDRVITGEEIVSATPNPKMSMGGGGAWQVSFKLNEFGSKKFDDAAARLHAQNPWGRIAIVIDGKLESAPVVQTDNYDGEGVISGQFDEDGARRLAIVLRSGSLPVEIGRRGDNNIPIVKEPEAENFIGPSLGEDSITRGLWACLVSLGLVALFMLAYYRAGGAIAVVGLLLNLLFILALMALFKATLTLPGIAGLVLTIGMALDANILVLERIREEMQRGKTAMQAFEAGYHRAFSTIVDSNLTTLVAAIVMYYFGTGAIKGFAVTLSLGILTTLITVLWCCKVFQRSLVQNGTITQWKMGQMFKTPNVDFVKLAPAAVVISGIIMVLSVAIFAKRGETQFGIDLKGGSMVHWAFATPQPIDQVRAKVAGIKEKVDGREIEKYPDAEIMTVAEARAGALARKESFQFQLRTVRPEKDQLKADLQAAFAGTLSHEPFESVESVTPNDFDFDGRGRGAALNIYFQDGPDFALDKIDTEIAGAVKDLLEEDGNKRPCFSLTILSDAPAGLKKVQLIISKPDAARANRLTEVKERVRSLGKSGKIPLCRDPFVATESVHAAVATELQHSAAWSMIWSWALMIVYVAFRFSKIAFGVAAVIALVHDAILAIGFTSLAGWIVPRSWGLSFEMNMNTVAAVLTIIGFSINDTIVTFDRMRENFGLMKKESLKEIINASINQTLSRTILTAFTVWVTCIILYFFTMTSGGGIASFAFPLLMGVIVGSYSTIYIAAPILMWWFKGKRPEVA